MERVIRHDGLTRRYYVNIPANSTLPMGLIIAMHGYSGSGQANSFGGLNQYAFAENMAVIEPSGAFRAWDVGSYWSSTGVDEPGFIRKVIELALDEFDIDRERIYACGMSNGGYMAYELMGYLSDIITAFGSVTGNFMLNSYETEHFKPKRDMPLIHIHGTADYVVGYYSHFDNSLTVLEAVEYWRQHNGLPLEEVTSIGQRTTMYTYSSNEKDVKVIHYKVEGGGHSWEMTNDFDTDEVLVDFFKNFKLSQFSEPEDKNVDFSIDIYDITEARTVSEINAIINRIKENSV